MSKKRGKNPLMFALQYFRCLHLNMGVSFSNLFLFQIKSGGYTVMTFFCQVLPYPALGWHFVGSVRKREKRSLRHGL